MVETGSHQLTIGDLRDISQRSTNEIYRVNAGFLIRDFDEMVADGRLPSSKDQAELEGEKNEPGPILRHSMFELDTENGLFRVYTTRKTFSMQPMDEKFAAVLMRNIGNFIGLSDFMQVWSEKHVENPAGAVRTHVHRVREALKENGISAEGFPRGLIEQNRGRAAYRMLDPQIHTPIPRFRAK